MQVDGAAGDRVNHEPGVGLVDPEIEALVEPARRRALVDRTGLRLSAEKNKRDEQRMNGNAYRRSCLYRPGEMKSQT